MSAKKLSLKTMIAYGLPALPLAALTMPIYIFLPTFYAQSMGLGLATVGTILLVARIWDVITDPVIGIMGDAYPTPFGRRRPWVVAWAPLVMIASWFLMVPMAGADALYLLLWSILLYFGWTCMILPLNAWGAELSNDYKERSAITGWREGFTVAGILIALGLIAAFGYTGEGAEGKALEIIAWFMVILTPITVVILMLFVPEPGTLQKTEVTFGQGLKILQKNAPFRRLVLSYLINGVANGLPATLFLLFVEFGLGMKEKSGELLFIYFLCGVLAVPFWIYLSNKFGKHKTWCYAMIWACVFFLLVPWVGPGDYWLFLMITVLTGISLGADLTLPASMQADVVDVDTLETGQQRTGLYFALWSMATKMSLALAAGLAFPTLEIFGFSAEDGGNLYILIFLYALLPVLLKAFSIWIMWYHPLTEEIVEENRKAIESKWH